MIQSVSQRQTGSVIEIPMRAIKTLFVAVAGIQASAGNALPKLTAWVLLCGQLSGLMYCVVQRHIDQEQEALATSVILSALVIFPVTAFLHVNAIPREELSKVKIRGALIFFGSTLLLAGVAHFSPELSVALYLLLAFLPLDKVLNVKMAR